ncbi:MAG: sulfite exporter TauE/SafE family protein [Pirellulales bacterium]
MSFDQIVQVALILLGSSMIQGMVGFASGMVAIPSLLIVGASLNEAVAISAVAAFAQNLLGVYSLRREIAFREAVRPILIRFAALPLGILALKLSGHLDPHRVRQIVGAVVLIALAMMIRSPDRSRQRWPAIWDYLAFLSSGFLVGFCGIGGPPLVMWAIAQGWPPGRTRGFLFFVFFSSMFPQLLLLGVAYGQEIVPSMLLGVAGAPIVLAGTYLGLLAGKRFSRKWLRAVSFGILLVMAVREIVGPLLH